MLQKWICSWSVLLVVTATALSDETPAAQGVKKQRVSPKLLREAMALPEYKGQPAPTSPPPSLEHLQRLSEKLKTNGDTDGSELLQRFMQEHQRLANQSSRLTENEPALNVRCQVIEVQTEKLPKDSILHNGLPDRQHTDAFCKELNQAVLAKHATRLFEPVTLSTRVNEVGHFHQGDEFLFPSSDGSFASKFRRTGTMIEVFVTPIEQNKTRLELVIELIDPMLASASNDSGSSLNTAGHRKMEATFDAVIGESAIQAIPSEKQGHKIFCVTRIMPKK
ncbi:MAG: hypothetical protein WCH39_27165 [Schlesneria sp.]